MKKTFLFFVIFIAACETSQAPSSQPIEAAKYNLALGLDYLQQHQWVEAQQKLFLSTTQNPRAAEGWEGLAYFFQKTARPAVARKYYQKALALAPHDAALLNNYGAFLCQQGESLEGIKLLEQALKDIHYAYPEKIQENIKICQALEKFQGVASQAQTR